MTQSVLQTANDIVEACPYTRKMKSAHKLLLAAMFAEELSRYGQERYLDGRTTGHLICFTEEHKP